MEIGKARKLNHGDVVHFPEDRGDASGCGKVCGDSHKTSSESSALSGKKYVYIIIDVNGKKAVWPSNRLG